MTIDLILEGEGPEDERTYTLPDQEKVVIGRDRKQCDFAITSNSISRRHCEISSYEGYCTIRDLGSSGGTFLNGFGLLAQEETVFRSGDKLNLAKKVNYEVRIR
jgi:pSer/pThr/pTyr-binding forkhead associated (FHA) protein